MKVISSLFVLVLQLTFLSCSTLKLRSANDDQELTKAINSVNDSYLVSADTPYIFDKETLNYFVHDYIAKNCKDEEKKDIALISTECSEGIISSGEKKLEERYFDADVDLLRQACTLAPLPCLELPTLEYLFRISHNIGIEKSRREKLALLKLWKDGQLSKAKLMESLHLPVVPGTTLVGKK